MLRIRPIAALAPLLILVSLSSCSLMGDPENPNEGPKGPLFEAVDYRVNAANYFDRGFYDRARHQYETSLEIEPDNWGARLGIAACDAYEGSALLDQGDLARGKKLLLRAEQRTKALWDGTIANTTLDAPDSLINPWRAAMTLAMIWRFQADAARIEVASLLGALRHARNRQLIPQWVSAA